MIGAAEVARLRAPGVVVVEFVQGTRDGQRMAMPREVVTGNATTHVWPDGETYRRRPRAEPCRVDDVEVWHLDVVREVPA